MNIQTLLNDQCRYIIRHLQDFIDNYNKPLSDKSLLDIYQVIQMIRLHVEIEKKYLYAILQKNPTFSANHAATLERMAHEHRSLLLLMDRINISHIDEPFLYDKATQLMEKFCTHAEDDQSKFFAHACNTLSRQECEAMMTEINQKMTDQILRQMAPVV